MPRFVRLAERGIFRLNLKLPRCPCVLARASRRPRRRHVAVTLPLAPPATAPRTTMARLVRRTLVTLNSGERRAGGWLLGVGGRGRSVPGRATVTGALSTNGDVLPNASLARTRNRTLPPGLPGYVAPVCVVAVNHGAKAAEPSATSTAKVAPSSALHSTGIPVSGAAVAGTAIVT